MTRWEAEACAFLAFVRYAEPIRRDLYTTNGLERPVRGVKRARVVEVFCGEEAVGKPLYLVLSNLDERREERRLRGFAEIHTGSYHAA